MCEHDLPQMRSLDGAGGCVMILAIASGKGGTGKTTVACNLAAAVDSPLVLADCDVEEPNAHLFLRPEWDGTGAVTVDVPSIDMSKCTLCGACQELCQFKALALLPDTVMTFPELCHSCGGCALVCPEDAVSWVPRQVGTLRTGRRGKIRFVDGTLRIGEAMAPPLIRKVRQAAAQIADSRLIIVDAPPGTSCPVVVSLWGADYVLLVTEPTPFGLNDLELAAAAVRKLGIPCGLLINRCDVGDDRIHAFAQREGIPILLEIPFHRKVAEHCAKGDLLVDVFPQWKSMMERLYESIVSTHETLSRNVLTGMTASSGPRDEVGK